MMTDDRDALLVAHTSDGRMVRRPLSPHLQVYRPQLSSVLSIMNRVTGIAISAGTLLLVWWLVAAASGPSAYQTVSEFLRSFVGLFVLFGWTGSLMYHFFASLRHLAWDAGFGYSLPQMRITGLAAVIATGVSTILIWAVGLLVLR